MLVFALIAFAGLAFVDDLKQTFKRSWASDKQGGGDLTMSFSASPSREDWRRRRLSILIARNQMSRTLFTKIGKRAQD
ncbi:MAG: hypothetical protein WB992_12465, partial [Bryobacteraceae bacterium]